MVVVTGRLSFLLLQVLAEAVCLPFSRPLACRCLIMMPRLLSLAPVCFPQQAPPGMKGRRLVPLVWRFLCRL